MTSRRKLLARLAERDRLLAHLALRSGANAAKLREIHGRHIWHRPHSPLGEAATTLEEVHQSLAGALEPPARPSTAERLDAYLREWRRVFWDNPRQGRTEGREIAVAERAAGIMAKRAAADAEAAEEAREAEFRQLWPPGMYDGVFED